MRGLPGPGLEPVSLTLAGGFLTTAPPGQSKAWSLKRWTTGDVPGPSFCNRGLWESDDEHEVATTMTPVSGQSTFFTGRFR